VLKIGDKKFLEVVILQCINGRFEKEIITGVNLEKIKKQISCDFNQP